MILGILGVWNDAGLMAFAARLLFGVSAVWLAAAVGAMALRRSSAALRDRIWALGVVASLILPVAALLLPEWRVGMMPAAAPSRAAAGPVARMPGVRDQPVAATAGRVTLSRYSGDGEGLAPSPSQGEGRGEGETPQSPPRSIRPPSPAPSATDGVTRDRDHSTWLLLAWLIPASWLVLRHAVALAAARNLRQRATPIDDPATTALSRLAKQYGLTFTPHLLESPSAGSPICLGWLRPAIILPDTWRQWPAGQLEAVLTHELAHAARRDVLWQLLARLACAAYWFHPLAWLAAWRIRVERELACDDWVLRGGECSTRYARWLLEVAALLSGRTCAEGAGVAMASGNSFERRIAAILDPRRRRFALSRRMATGLTVLAVVLLAIAGTISPLAPNKAAAQAANIPAQPTATTRPTVRVGNRVMAMNPVSGRVEDEQGKPVADALVEADIAARWRSTRTAAEGRFTLDVTEGVSTYVHASTADGLRQAFVACEKTQTSPKNLRIVLKPAREFTVMVKDDKDQPVGSARVLCTASYMKVAEAATDAAGKAVLRIPTDAPPMYIVATKEGQGLDYVAFWRQDQAKTDPYRLAHDYSGPVNLVLNGVKKVKVRVTDEQGKPLPGVSVFPWLYEKPKKGTDLNLSGLAAFYRTTDAEGAAEFEVPADNGRSVNFWTRRDGYCAPKRCLWDAKSGAAEVQQTMLRMLTVTGRVVDATGHGVAGALVRAGGRNYDSDMFRGEITTAEDGAFQLDVDPETYYLFVASKDRLVSKGHAEMIRKQAPTAPIQLTLGPAMRLSVRATGGPENTPVPNASISLMQSDDGYYKLPQEQQFPGGTVGRLHIAPSVFLNASTDERGHAEFWVGPGELGVRAYVGGANLAEDFTLSEDGQYTINRYTANRDKPKPRMISNENGLEMTLNFPDAKPAARWLKGRVVLREQPDAGVAEAVLRGEDVGEEHIAIEATSDAQGSFTVRRGSSDLYVWAVTADKKMAGIIKVGKDEDNASVPVGLTASAHGRLVDGAGNALAGRQIDYGFRIKHPSGTFGDRFGGTVRTGENGEFVVEGLVPGYAYELNVALEFGDEGRPRVWRTIGQAKADKAVRGELGDLTLTVPSQVKPGP